MRCREREACHRRFRRPDLAGAVDIDISVSPFTNTLPIRRLRLARGLAADLTMAYVRVPELIDVPDPQR
jgi:hypothetical protein